MVEVKHAEFGELIREMRMAYKPKLSLRQLAIRCNISAAYMSNIERGYCPPPSAEVVKALAKELGENPTVLLLKANRADNSILRSGVRNLDALVLALKFIDLAITKDLLEDDLISFKNLLALLIADFEVPKLEDIGQLEILAHSVTAYDQLKKQETNPSPEIAAKLEYGTHILKSFMTDLFVKTELNTVVKELTDLLEAQKQLTSASSSEKDNPE